MNGIRRNLRTELKYSLDILYMDLIAHRFTNIQYKFFFPGDRQYHTNRILEIAPNLGYNKLR